MRASIVIAACNEGELLWKTIQSTIETAGNLRCEIVVVDDASTDGCAEEARRRSPEVRVFRNQVRRGGPASKDLAARKARGKVLVFQDGHCKPEPWAIERLINDVEELRGEALFMPRVPALDCARWENQMNQVGYGYSMTLESFDNGWFQNVEKMRQRGRFLESPALQGCCFALSRKLYKKLRGFDPDMIEWGTEDLDLGLKAWLMGHPILHDPTATIGHRFRQDFDTFSVSQEAPAVNRLRMARKNFTDQVWEEWVRGFKAHHSAELWEIAWRRFTEKRASVEREREFLLRRRVHDEFWYAGYFGLSWPVRSALSSTP
ncbi:MAG: glycosyltransferase [Planctomycetes bacterium]|nr:glycosyltransferase [Planctomycetota bacterium]